MGYLTNQKIENKIQEVYPCKCNQNKRDTINRDYTDQQRLALKKLSGRGCTFCTLFNSQEIKNDHEIS